MIIYKAVNNEVLFGIKGVLKKCCFLNAKYLKEEKYRKVLKKKEDLVFWLYLPDLKGAASIARPEIMEMLENLQSFDSFGIIVTSLRYSAPYPEFYKMFAGNSEITVVSDQIGNAAITLQTKTKAVLTDIDNDNSEWLLAKNLEATFIYECEFFEDIKTEIAYNWDNFIPADYAHCKLQLWQKFCYDLHFLQKHKPEILYVVGPPVSGKTSLSAQIAREWNYQYTQNTDNLNLNSSFVVDANCVDKSDYLILDPEHTRIFIIKEDCGEETEKAIMRHNYLVHATIYNKFAKKKTKKFDAINKYYAKRSLPDNIKVEHIPFLPGELYRSHNWSWFY